MKRNSTQEALQNRVKEMWAELTALVGLLEHIGLQAEPVNANAQTWGDDLAAAQELGRSLVSKAATLTSDLDTLNHVFSVEAA